MDPLDDPSDVYEKFLNNVKIKSGFECHAHVTAFFSWTNDWNLCHPFCFKYRRLKFNDGKLDWARKTTNRSHSPDEQVTRKKSKRRSLDVHNCLLCEEGTEKGALREVQMLKHDANIRRMTIKLNETELLTRIEAKYYIRCLKDLRNRHRKNVTMQSRAEQKRIPGRKKKQVQVFHRAGETHRGASHSWGLVFQA